MPEPSAAGTHVPSHQPTWATPLGAWDDKMAINYHYLMNLPPLVVHQRYTARDTILYALGVGAGLAAANDPHYLRLVYEKDLAALPTMATVLAYPGFWAKDPKYGIAWRKLLHRDQSIEIHGAIPVEGEVRGEMTIDEVYDRGAEKGALLCFSRRIYNSANGDLVATVRQVNVLRADGGFGGPEDRTPPPNKPPERAADGIVRLATNRDQALVYRLSGDLNPLHVDPAVAIAAGFERPILHGLASFGIAGLAFAGRPGAADYGSLRRFEARFSAAVYPGETFEVSIWHLAPGRSAFQARVVERDTVVIRDGRVDYLP
jgi:acyl dehydratase